MNAVELLDAVQDANETELSRLGSSKSLYAATGGEMEAEAVLRAAADAEYHAGETFEEWARTEEADSPAQQAFAAAADEEGDHYETVVSKLDGHEPSDDPSEMQQYLRDLDDTVERAGGFLGRVLATEKSKDQLVGFFVGQADPQTAQTFRDLRGDLDDQRERALDLLEEVCEDEDDWERAETAANEAVQHAYEEYVEQLESMGVNPKPVC
ncbi:transcription antitermination protein [Halospeciosus flavus]|uniref:Rubrerythrin family protein n=1 Tax=Halospeciosus flavus TaxID=3032283 RepID=A0ABD5Z7A7_9EURY|nr:transcription antitermination protein [Halospeciosus flavus]